ncbi:MAG: phosphopentomutase [Planktomarina sp.]
MSRAFLIVLDSVGCGGAPDAAAFGDQGANTLGHILQHRQGRLHLPNLASMGLGAAMTHATGISTPWAAPDKGGWAVATEVSMGKDTPSGHWELAGVPVPWDWHYFPKQEPAFSQDILDVVADFAGGSLGNCHSGGIAAINRFGADHLRTGFPICYTSVDSVFQIAAHEGSFGLDRLYDLCKTLAPMLHAMKVGRVIARPFVGAVEEGFERTINRKDFAIPPPAPTLCEWLTAAGRTVHGIGKIGDIFSMQGITRCRKGTDATLMEYLADEVANAPDGSLTFANFVEFDSLFGHLRNPEGYAKALEWFDDAIGPILARARPDDLFVFTADHGNDPTWPGSDHTRERVPVLVHGRDLGQIGDVGFQDVAASVAHHLGVMAQGKGRSFL